MNKDQFLCPNDGTPMRRDLRPVTLTYKGENLTFDLAGWYCDKCGERSEEHTSELQSH